MAEEPDSEHAGFLPPQAGGLEPDLGSEPADRTAGDPAPGPGQTYAGFAPPGGTEASTPPPAPWGSSQQAAQPTQPSPAAAATGAGVPRHVEPDNGSAVAGFVLSVVSAGLLLISFGVSSILSLLCSGLGVFYGVRGKRAIAEGRTTRQAGLAQAGYVIGIIGLVVATLATVVYAVALVQAIQDGTLEDWWHDLERDLEEDRDTQGGDDSRAEPALLALARVGALAARVGGALLT